MMPRFDNVLSFGNIIQLVAFLVMFSIAWGSAHQRISTLETSQETLRQGGIDREVRLRAIEVAASRSDERIESLLRAMEDLKREQRETNSLLRGMGVGE